MNAPSHTKQLVCNMTHCAMLIDVLQSALQCVFLPQSTELAYMADERDYRQNNQFYEKDFCFWQNATSSVANVIGVVCRIHKCFGAIIYGHRLR